MSVETTYPTSNQTSRDAKYHYYGFKIEAISEVMGFNKYKLANPQISHFIPHLSHDIQHHRGALWMTRSKF
jgi:hypothetical protein